MIDDPFSNRRQFRELDEKFFEKNGLRRYHDTRFDAVAVKVRPGEHYVTGQKGEMIVTVLGSCVAACIRDPMTGIGGMNHFMLPESADGKWGQASSSLRYGNFAMERLINDLLSYGARKDRLEIKVFGGGNILQQSGAIGYANADFVESYLSEEGFSIAARHLRGSLPRRVHYFPGTGKVMMLELKRRDDLKIVSIEEEFRTDLQKGTPGGSIELFD